MVYKSMVVHYTVFVCICVSGGVYSLAWSFGVFVDGPVFNEDADKWKDVLESYWQGIPDYVEYTVTIGHSEIYYTVWG